MAAEVIRPEYPFWKNTEPFDFDKPRCSFCGASEKDCKKLIRGLRGIICDDCVRIAAKLK